jgi:hypothetical protein
MPPDDAQWILVSGDDHMTTTTLPPAPDDSPRTLTAKTALKLAWLSWAVLLAAPYLLLLGFIVYAASGSARWVHYDTQSWFLAATAYLLIVVLASYFWRGRLFRDYWLGHPMPPRKYVLATTIAGLALGLGGILSLIGFLITYSPMPNLIPGFLAMVLYVLCVPKPRAVES